MSKLNEISPYPGLIKKASEANLSLGAWLQISNLQRMYPQVTITAKQTENNISVTIHRPEYRKVVECRVACILKSVSPLCINPTNATLTTV